MDYFNVVVSLLVLLGVVAVYLRRPSTPISTEDAVQDGKLQQQAEDKKKEISELKEEMSKVEEEQKKTPTPEDFWKHN